ncbi:STE3-domain-containing protein [Rickenella mellea]|uniref:STE3-domain-containing protein n=1 Tax=Rickenella mellea TaxID=50990 RepID=A0A4Y7PIZ3_9AGAM|nr:STE3-domain-containing protein [Rickenella mellea]
MAPLHPTYPAFPIMAFLGFITPLVPLTWIGTDNTGVIMYAIWISLACLDRFINSIMWYGNTLNPTPIYCDISSRFVIGVSVAIPAASMCIIRRLYLISSMKYFLADARQKIRALIEDLLICVGIPILQMSGHRFDILEDIGCVPFPYNVWPTYLITYSWPLILGLIGMIYGALVLRIIFRKRRELNELLTHESIPRHHYNRLVIFACVPMCFTTALAIVVIILNLITETVFPYRGWADTHAHYSRVHQVPAILWRANPRLEMILELNQWSLILCSTVFFCFFGFSGEAMKAYRKAFWTVAGGLGFTQKDAQLTPLTTSRYTCLQNLIEFSNALIFPSVGNDERHQMWLRSQIFVTCLFSRGLYMLSNLCMQIQQGTHRLSPSASKLTNTTKMAVPKMDKALRHRGIFLRHVQTLSMEMFESRRRKYVVLLLECVQ